MSDLSRLCEAVRYGNKAEILNLLKEIPKNVNLVTPATYYEDTFLHLAFDNKDLSEAELIEILKLFLNRGIDINLQNSDMKTILHLAIERRLKDVIYLCICLNIDLNLTTTGGSTYAHFVIEEECRKYHSSIRRYGGDVERLELLEKESANFVEWMASWGIDFFYKRAGRYSALYLAIELNLQHIIVALLKYVTDLARAEKDYQTSFLCAFLEKRDIYFESHFKHRNLAPIDSQIYESRYVYNVVKIMLNKNRSMSDAMLMMALFTAIDNYEKIDVIELLVLRVADVYNYYKISNINNDDKSLIELYYEKIERCGRILCNIDHKEFNETLKLKGMNISTPKARTDIFAPFLFRRYPCQKILQLLREIGADFSARGYNDENFLHLIGRYTSGCYSAGMIDFITKKGSDLDVKNTKGETPLMVAATVKNVSVATRLFELGANINIASNDGRSPLSVSCATEQVELAEKLIGWGADLKHRDKNGKTLLHFAVNNEKVAELLIKNGVNVNSTDDFGKTPLHYAMTDEVVKILFQAGAHVDVLDQEGHSPFYDSLSRENTKMILQLIKCGADVRDSKAFDYLDKYFQKSGQINNPKLRFLWHIFVKLFAVDFCGEINDFGTNGIDRALQMFFKECQTEVEKLQNFLIDDCTSLYKLLHKNRNRRCAYVENGKLKNLVKDTGINQKFPNYFDLILGCYNDAVTRKPLLESAIYVLNELVVMPLPDLCADKIFMYLTNGDLVRFLEVGEDVNEIELRKSVIKMYL